ncbi:MAG: hypothetical protein JXK05_04535 [Campylobacterales bacterium]|nr:hypothetical protein [Campylobacterales bacterium]
MRFYLSAIPSCLILLLSGCIQPHPSSIENTRKVDEFKGTIEYKASYSNSDENGNCTLNLYSSTKDSKTDYRVLFQPVYHVGAGLVAKQHFESG